MGKRANNQATGKATKTPKLDPAFAPVADVLKNAGHLPERCRSMLIDLLPFSLVLAADTRSESQTTVVGMMEEAFMTVKSEMEAEVTSQMEKKQSTETAMADHGRVVEEGGNALNSQKEITDAAKSALDDATKAMDESQQTLTEKQNAQKSGDENLTTTRANKNSLEVVFKSISRLQWKSRKPQIMGHWNHFSISLISSNHYSLLCQELARKIKVIEETLMRLS